MTADIEKLVGQRCWHVSVGGATTPSFVLAFGELVPREVPLRNPTQPESFRTNRGSIELLVWSSWRASRDNQIAATSAHDDITSIATLITGALVTAVECRPPFWDLRLELDNHVVLETFSDGAREAPIETNWELWVGKRHLVAGPGDAVDG